MKDKATGAAEVGWQLHEGADIPVKALLRVHSAPRSSLAFFGLELMVLSNENRVMGFHDVFMDLFTPSQMTQNKTVFIGHWSNDKKQ